MYCPVYPYQLTVENTNLLTYVFKRCFVIFACVQICVKKQKKEVCVCESVCVSACVCAFMLYALNFDNIHVFVKNM